MAFPEVASRARSGAQAPWAAASQPGSGHRCTAGGGQEGVVLALLGYGLGPPAAARNAGQTPRLTSSHQPLLGSGFSPNAASVFNDGRVRRPQERHKDYSGFPRALTQVHSRGGRGRAPFLQPVLCSLRVRDQVLDHASASRRPSVQMPH